MLGHLRFHRRGHSNPSSPALDQLSPFDPGDALSPDPERAPHRKTSKQSLNDAVSPPVRSPSSGLESGFMGGLALQNYRRAFGSARLEPSDPPAESSSFDKSSQGAPRSKPVPPPIDTNLPLARPPPVPVSDGKSSISSASSPPCVPQQPGAQNSAGATGKRPPGAKVTSEPPTLARSQTAAETQRGKKGLPFLKNPMSGLLMRRKASQNAPDLRPLPLPQKPTESTYDPRIRGTRVHDFSAPRQRVVPTRKPTVPGAEVWTGWDKYRSGPQSHPSDLPLRTEPSKSSLAASSDATQVAASDSDDPKRSIDNASASASEGSVAPAQFSTQSDQHAPPKETPVPTKPPVPSGVSKLASFTSTKSRTISAASSMQKRNMSTRTNRSHHTSLSEDTTLSALPKHMKSTSSRFSFDMIGAARAEKLLEERHRQRELERKANGEPPARDSRYDDFDEDAFDYDAAMDDGGFEEAIPGVNADFEDEYYEEDIPMVGEDIIMDEDVDDPDNDQENFAGFVFSRSNPHSSLVTPVTPGMVTTPRDSTGRPIGHAITTDGTPDLLSAPSPLSGETFLTETQDEEPRLAGLGIQGIEVPAKKSYDPTVFQERRNMPIDDSAASHSTQDKGMYYDAGLLEELQMEADEIQRSDFDESIFDEVDTDQFGRPIPGAFAQNQALREKEVKKRDSGMPSHSEPSSPTVSTPIKADPQSVAAEDEDSIAEESKTLSPVPQTPPKELSLEPTAAAYQKALADAAHKAAATGWKSRWDDEPDSPEPLKEPDVTITSPTTDSQPSTAGIEDENTLYAGYDEDDGFSGGFDDAYDDDLLDDAFIAEANAEALAYDSEGFYGDEFGFYLAPVTRNVSHGSSAPSNSSSLGESQYGGYFGPSGVIGRSASGRVLREPNLTPITERSEYSNRNSMMSMVMPSATLSDLRNSMASPAFAHMAPGIDDSETFSLSGLQRLRGKTFGGSQVSLNSSRDGSPRSERAPMYDRFEAASPSAPWELMRPQSHLGNGSGGPLPHERKNSAYSLWSNSDAASGTGSPTLTVASLALSNNSVPPPPIFSPPPPPIPQPSPGLQCPPVLEDEAEEISSPDGLLQKASTDDDLEVNDSNAAATTLGNAAPTLADDPSLLGAKIIHADLIGEDAPMEVDETAHASPNNTPPQQASEEGFSLPESKTPILSRPLSLAFASPTVTHIASTLGFGFTSEMTPILSSNINQGNDANNKSPNYYPSRFSTPPTATAPFTSRFSSKAPMSAYQVAVPPTSAPTSPGLVGSAPESPAFPQQQYNHIHSRDNNNNRVSTPSLSTATRFSVSSLED